MRRTFLAAALALTVLGPGSTAVGQPSDTERPAPSRTYRMLFDARIVPSERSAHVRVEVAGGGLLRSVDFRVDPDRHTRFEGDGKITRDGDRIVWEPPPTGGELRYRFHINHLRDERSYDARATPTWALFRGGHLVPPARVRARRGSESVSRLRLRLPEGWGAATPYARLTTGDYRIEHTRRAFDRPVGWILVGELGVVRETVNDMRVAIAAPANHGMRRHDILALLRWSADALQGVFGELPERLTIVGAGDPMWRGGLSAPGSLYVHASRPLITEDGTSPLLHEVMHTLLGLRANDATDWLVEGFAEYYAVEILRRSETISEERHRQILERQAAKARRNRKRGAAFGVGYLTALDERIRSESEQQRSLDGVARWFAARRPELTRATFEQALREAAGVELEDWPE